MRPAVRAAAATLLCLPLLALAAAGPGQARGAPQCLGREATITSDDERVVGTEGNDVIVTTGDRVDARGGDDRVCGGRGVQGGDGDDRLTSDREDAVLDGGRGTDRCRGHAVNACEGPLHYPPLDTPCYGRAPTITASDGELVRGTPGPDVIRVQGGPVLAGSGDDRVCGAWRAGGQGGDDLLQAAWGPLFTPSGGGPGDDLLRNTSPVRYDAFPRLFGGPGSDILVGSASEDELQGGPGADDLRGRGFPDTLLGRRGRDRMAGQRGPDVLFGNRGTDLALGGSGDDLMRGGRGARDVGDGGSGEDECYRFEVVRSCEP